MDNKSRQLYPLFGWAAALGALFQIIGLVRYVNRLPGDWSGIILYAITIAAFIATSAGCQTQGSEPIDAEVDIGTHSLHPRS